MEPGPVTDDVLLASIIHKKTKLEPLLHNSYPTTQTSVRKKTTRDYGDKLWNRLGDTDVLNDELQTHYGSKARDVAVKNYVKHGTSGQPPVLDEILTSRHQKHAHSQQVNADNIRELAAQRQRLLQKQEELQQRKPLTVPRAEPSFTFSGLTLSERPPWDGDERFIPSRSPHSPHGVHGVQSYIRYTSDKLPADIARYHKLRSEIEREHCRLHAPYNGELGPRSYHNWQMEDYLMVRSIVEEVVDKFLDMYFLKLPPAVNIDTAYAVLAAEEQEWSRKRQHILETNAIQLIMEEIVLQCTRQLTEDAAEEFFNLYHSMHNSSNLAIMRAVEIIATDNDEGRSKTDPIYPLVTKTFYSMQRERDQHKLNVFCHSQPLKSTETVPGHDKKDAQ